MSNAVILSKRSVDIDTQSIEIEFDIGGPVTETIVFTGLNTLEQVRDTINAYSPANYQCNIEEDYIRIEAVSGAIEILSVVVTGTELQNMLGGVFTISSTVSNNYAYSTTWGNARIPFMFALTTTDLLIGGVKDRNPFTKKLSSKDYIGKNNTSSSKFIMRKGYDFILRMDYNQIDWLADFLEFSRNEAVKVINGSDYNFDENDEWEVLTEYTDNATGVYNYLDVLEMNLGLLKKV